MKIFFEIVPSIKYGKNAVITASKAFEFSFHTIFNILFGEFY